MLWLWLCLPAAVVGASALRTWPPQLSARIPAALREQPDRQGVGTTPAARRLLHHEGSGHTR